MTIAADKNRFFTFMLLLLLLIPLFKPAGLGQIEAVNLAYHLGKAISLCVIVLLFLGNVRTYRFDSLEVSLVVFWVAYAIGCYQSGSSYETVFNYSLTSLALLMLFKIEASLGQVRVLAGSLWLLFTFLLLFQSASIFIVKQGVVLFPSQYTYMYLFGEDNYSAFMTLPMMAVAFYVDAAGLAGNERWKHYLTQVTYLVVLASYLYVQSVAASVGFIILGLFYLKRNKTKSLARRLSPVSIFAGFVGLLSLVLVFHIQDFAGQLVSSFLDKNIFTLNSRTIIWSQAEGLFAARPFFGWGDGLSESMIWGGHAHNFLLQLLTVSGVTGTAAFLYYLGRAYANARVSIHSDSGVVLVGTLAAMALMSFFDFYIGISAIFCFVALVASVPGCLTAENEINKVETND